MIARKIRGPGGKTTGFQLLDDHGVEFIRIRRLPKSGDWTAWHLTDKNEGRKWRERLDLFRGERAPLHEVLAKVRQYRLNDEFVEEAIRIEDAREQWENRS